MSVRLSVMIASGCSLRIRSSLGLSAKEGPSIHRDCRRGKKSAARFQSGISITILWRAKEYERQCAYQCSCGKKTGFSAGRCCSKEPCRNRGRRSRNTFASAGCGACAATRTVFCRFSVERTKHRTANAHYLYSYRGTDSLCERRGRPWASYDQSRQSRSGGRTLVAVLVFSCSHTSHRVGRVRIQDQGSRQAASFPHFEVASMGDDCGDRCVCSLDIRSASDAFRSRKLVFVGTRLIPDIGRFGWTRDNRPLDATSTACLGR